MSYDEEKINTFKKQERDAKAEQLKKQNDKELETYREVQSKKYQEKWASFVDKAREKNLTADRDGKKVSRDEMFDNQLSNFLKEGANTTSDWREALTAILRLLTEFMLMLSAKKYSAFIDVHDAFSKKFEELAKKNSKLQMLGVAGLALLNPAQTLYLPLKANIVQKLKSGGEEAVLPVLQHQVHFQDGKVIIAPLTTERGVPITDALQRVFEHGVKLWLEGQNYEVVEVTKKIMDPNTNQFSTVLDGYQVTNLEKGSVMTEDDFNKIKKGLADFFVKNAELKYEERPVNQPTP